MVLGLVAVAGVVAYLLWQRWDEEPAILSDAPDQPDLTPAQTPPAPAPSDGPDAPDPAPVPSNETPTEAVAAPVAPAREYVAPHAIFGLGDRDALEDRPPGAMKCVRCVSVMRSRSSSAGAQRRPRGGREHGEEWERRWCPQGESNPCLDLERVPS